MFQISGNLKIRVKFSQKLFLGKSFLAAFATKVVLRNTIQRALFFNFAITFSQVQTDISINHCFLFFFLFHSFDRKKKSLYASFVALKGRERNSISWLDH